MLPARILDPWATVALALERAAHRSDVSLLQSTRKQQYAAASGTRGHYKAEEVVTVRSTKFQLSFIDI